MSTEHSAVGTAGAVGAVDGAERLARAALSCVLEPGDPQGLRDFGDTDPVGAWARLRAREARDERWHARVDRCDPERVLAEAAAASIRFLIPGDPEWPPALDILTGVGTVDRQGGAAWGLWVRGRHSLADTVARSVAMVGSRACTDYGGYVATELAAGLAPTGLALVSGGAYGIDAAAHRGTLGAGGTTVAVLACGVDVAYPRGHGALFGRIADGGLIVSELPPGATPTRLRFLTRNRLIAALTAGTVVVEAGLRSGALNTARWASMCSRELMGVPGPVTSAMSEGVHRLVRERGAVLVTTSGEILEVVGGLGAPPAPLHSGTVGAADRLGLDERRVLEALPADGSRDVAALAADAGVGPGQVTIALDVLVRRDLVSDVGGGRFALGGSR